MIACTVYNFITGRITGHIQCNVIDKFMQASSDEEHVLEGEHVDPAYYIRYGGKKVLRPVLDVLTEHTIAADGEAAVSFALPAGSQVESLPDGEMWPDEDVFHFSSEEVGTFKFRIYLPFPYQDPFKVTIHAH